MTFNIFRKLAWAVAVISAAAVAGCSGGADESSFLSEPGTAGSRAGERKPAVTAAVVTLYDNSGAAPMQIPPENSVCPAKALVVGVRPVCDTVPASTAMVLKSPIIDIKLFKVDAEGVETEINNCFLHYTPYSNESWLNQITYSQFATDNLNPKYGVTYLYGTDNAFYLAAMDNFEMLKGSYSVKGVLTMLDGTQVAAASQNVTVSYVSPQKP